MTQKRTPLEILRRAYNLGSVERHRAIDCGIKSSVDGWIVAGPFRIHYDRHSTGEGIYITIVHPDGENLEIVKQSFCPGYGTPDWHHWDCGPWDVSLGIALDAIEDANVRQEKVNRERAAEAARAKARAENERIEKFAKLFA